MVSSRQPAPQPRSDAHATTATTQSGQAAQGSRAALRGLAGGGVAAQERALTPGPEAGQSPTPTAAQGADAGTLNRVQGALQPQATGPAAVVTQLHRQLQRFHGLVEAQLAGHQVLMRNRTEHRAVGWVAEALSSSGDIPALGIWQRVNTWLAQAERRIAAYERHPGAEDLAAVNSAVREAQRQFDACVNDIHNYRERTESGAEQAVESLQNVVAVCTAVAAICGGGVAVAGAGVAATSATGIGVAALGSGGAAGLSTLATSGARRTVEVAAGDRGDFDLAGLLGEAGEAALTTFVSALVGGALARGFGLVFTRLVGPAAFLMGFPAVGQALAAGSGGRLVANFLSGAGTTLVMRAARLTVAWARTGRQPTAEQFKDHIVQEMLRDGVVQLLMGEVTHRATASEAIPSWMRGRAPTARGPEARPPEAADQNPRPSDERITTELGTSRRDTDAPGQTPTPAPTRATRTLTPDQAPTSSRNAGPQANTPATTTLVPRPPAARANPAPEAPVAHDTQGPQGPHDPNNAPTELDEDLWDGPRQPGQRSAIPPPTGRITLAEADRILGGMRRLNFRSTELDAHGNPVRMPVPYHYPSDGCYDRAHMMAQYMTQEGITSQRAFAVSRIASGGLEVATPHAGDMAGTPRQQWQYHVAPMAIVETPSGPVEMVFDPSIEGAHPLTYDQWMGRMTGGGSYQRMSMGDLHALANANGGRVPTPRPIAISGDSNAYGPPLHLDPNSPWDGVPNDFHGQTRESAANAHEAVRDRMTGYARLVPVRELAANIRTLGVADTPGILRLLRAAPAPVLQRFVQPAAHEGFGDNLIPEIRAAATDPDTRRALDALLARYQ